MTRFRITVFWQIAFALAAGCCWAGESLTIVEKSKPRAVIAMGADVSGQTEAAARMLADYIRRSSGAEMPISRGPIDDTLDNTLDKALAQKYPLAIHVGKSAYTKKLDLKLDDLDDDGFVIHWPDKHNVVIVGPTPWGTEFGVCEFLERYLGVRWLMPGPAGEDLPSRDTIAVPCEEVRQEPAIFSRQFSGLRGDANVWARRNRMHGRVSFHHNLQRLVAPEKYAKTHPHFFPIRKGQRYIPKDSNTHGWQPCFTAEGLVEEAVKSICEYFAKHPEATSYSLGVVDSSGHCECEKCLSTDSGQKNFLGRRDVSDRYYGWCNRVVEGVVKKYPHKYFGCLAYSEVAQPPTLFKVHPRIIPYMTYDRMKWKDAEIKAAGHRTTQQWRETSPTLGWYDYIYGSSYCVPRVWFHHMADYYRYGHSQGVRAMYAEAYPNWGEGPKLYVSLKLQWDPGRDVDALLRDWYVRAVGCRAADDLAAYYAHWEDFWTRRIFSSPWYTQRGQYLQFYNPAYLDDVSEADIAKSRGLLEKVVQKADTPEQKIRAGFLLKMFEYYEASTIAYHGNRKAKAGVPKTEAEALARLDEAERCLLMAHRRRELLDKDFAGMKNLFCPIYSPNVPLLRGDDWGDKLPGTVSDWIGRSEAVYKRLETMAKSPSPSVAAVARSMLVAFEKTSKQPQP
ncbi:MAG: DUF4838 domain-containing protein [Planctomycetota bacterium]|nr:DUF4838 domain-containing protein [Planctomycetota bacterium]